MIPKALLATRFFNDLVDRGVVQEGQGIRKVIVVAEVGQLVRIWVEHFGDERLVGVLPPGLEDSAL